MLGDEILKIGSYMGESFLHIWPYLVVTIPLAVAIQMSGASKHIKRAFSAKPFTAIILATVVGAFSPFCSCGVIPVIASLLISGVPLAPVMSFWIASPSMDPEIFFLSVGMIGWELAVWRLAATLVLSFAAGVVTHGLMQKGWLGQSILRSRKSSPVQGTWEVIKKGWAHLKSRTGSSRPGRQQSGSPESPTETLLQLAPVLQASNLAPAAAGSASCQSCASETASLPLQSIQPAGSSANTAATACCSGSPVESICCDTSASFKSRLLKETLAATLMVAKFMALAFILEALITFYVPASWITGTLGAQSPLAIMSAALLGVPAYTTSLTALPMISGLLTQGMNPAAALAFLVAGPVTTLPAMAAVWPLVARRVFVLYGSFALAGAVLIGYIYSIIAAFN